MRAVFSPPLVLSSCQMIGTTRHSFKHLNKHKRERLESFVQEYSRACIQAIDLIWHEYVEKDNLSIPKRIDYKQFKINHNLSSRAFQCAVNQAGGIVRSVIEKQRRRKWVNEKKGVNLKSLKFSKPRLKFVAPELSANCFDFRFSESRFEGFARLKCLGKHFPQIIIPIERTKMSQKWINNGAKMCNSIKIFKDKCQLAWKVEKIPHPQGDKIVGADQGLKTVVTLSDGQTTPSTDIHGHSLESILNKLSRKKKGSKGFKKAQDHRKNFINWSINQLNLSNIKELRLEKVKNIRFKKRSSRKMSHWSNPEIVNKLKRRCEELEVPIVEQSSVFRSQRCSHCGLTRKANRKGKTYICKGCNSESDSDWNAAKNHECDLPDVPRTFLKRRLNLGDGFYWLPHGFFLPDGSELIVPDGKKNKFQ